jgi:hypothetical protein
MNTIINKLGEGNNPMQPLSFTWVAIFNDGSKIEQFTNGIEHRFQEIKDRFNDLVYFNLTNQNGKLFTVNLRDGLIGYNDLFMPYRELKEKKDNIRLIFFRRHKIEIGTKDLDEKSHQITYHLGFQYNTKEGINRKIIIIIDSEGNWTLGD